MIHKQMTKISAVLTVLLILIGCKENVDYPDNKYSRSLVIIGQVTNWVYDSMDYNLEGRVLRAERRVVSISNTNYRDVEYEYLTNRMKSVTITTISNNMTNRCGKILDYVNGFEIPSEIMLYEMDGFLTNITGWIKREFISNRVSLYFEMDLDSGFTNEIQMKTYEYREGNLTTMVNYHIYPELSDDNKIVMNTNTIIHKMSYNIQEELIKSRESEYEGDEMIYLRSTIHE